MRTLIKNGTIVTAVDTYQADVWVENGVIVGITHQSFADPRADHVIDAAGKYVMPGGIDAHTHLDMPFGGTTSSDDFETGTLAAAHGGTTSIVDFAIQTKGKTLRQGLDTWHQKAEGQAAVDYGFHMITTDVNDVTLTEMGELLREGVSSFKLFMAYPGVLMCDDGQIFRAMQKAHEIGGLICMHAENGLAIDILVQQALAMGMTAPKYHSLPPADRRGRGHPPRPGAGRDGAVAGVHRAPLGQPRPGQGDGGARPRHAGLRRDLPAVPVLLLRGAPRPARLRGRQVRVHAAAAPKAMQEDLWRGLRTNDLSVVSTDHCRSA